MSVNSFSSSSTAKGFRRALAGAAVWLGYAQEDTKEQQNSAAKPSSSSSSALSPYNRHHTQPTINKLVRSVIKDGVQAEDSNDKMKDASAALTSSFLLGPVSSLAADGLSRPYIARTPRSRSHSRVYGHNPMPLTLLRRRFDGDFQELGKLGSGAFGSVYRCQHVLDGNIYAVKKVVLPITLPNSAFELDYQAFVLDDFRKWIREAQTMAAVCKHPNLVQYHQSWLELLPRSQNTNLLLAAGSQSSSSFGESFSTPSSAPSLRNTDQCAVKNAVIPAYDESSGWNDDYSDGEDAPSEEMETCPVVDHSLVLFIQMELCTGASLYEWLRLPGRTIDPKENMMLFKQLMNGLDHLHSRGFVHRDIKPANLLIAPKLGRNKLKVGDFGCCKKLTDLQETPEDCELIRGETSPSFQHTQGCGTFFYMPPELHTAQYDERVDIFSAGIVLFELFNIFETEMERHEALTQLHEKRLVPSEFVKNYPTVANLVLKMTHRDPKQRPSAFEILNNSHFGLSPVEVLDLSFDSAEISAVTIETPRDQEKLELTSPLTTEPDRLAHTELSPL